MWGLFFNIYLQICLKTMKKFSSITGQSVGVEPTVTISKEDLEFDALKSSVLRIMNELLTIRSNGSVRYELFNNSITISGQDMCAEALINLFSDKTFKEQIKALESLKSVNKDWLSIDEEISNIESKIENKSYMSKMSNHAKKITSLLESYGNGDEFDVVLKNHVNRIKNAETAYVRYTVAEKMLGDDTYKKYSNENISKISESFLKRAKELGYNNDNGN